LGGLLVESAGWQAIFLVNLPFVAVAAWFAVRFLPRDNGRKGRGVRELDLPGLALFAGTMTGLLLVLLSLAGRPEWFLPPVCGVLAGLLVWRESRAHRPFLDVRLLASNRALTSAYVRTAATYTAFYLIFYGVPAWLESGRGLDPGTAGLVMLPVAGVGAVTAVLAGRLERRGGSRPLLVIGSVVLVVGGFALTRTTHEAPIVVLAGLSALLGLPNGFNSMGNQTSLYRAAPADQMGSAAGLYRSSQYVGANLAAAVMELTFSGPAADAGLHRLAWVVLCLGAVLAATALTSRHLRQT